MTKIVAGSITTDRMTAGTINADRLTAGSITTALMTAGTINADRLTAGSITTSLMTAGTIDGDRITTNTLDADRINAANLGAISANLGTVEVTNTLTMVSGGIFATSDAAPRWIFDIDSFGDQDFVFESDLPNEYAKGGLNTVLVDVPTTWEQGGIEIVSPTLGNATNRNYARVGAFADYVNLGSLADVRSWAWGTHHTETVVSAYSYGSGYATTTISATALGAGYALIYMQADQIQGPDGTGTAPGYAFQNDPNTGMRLYTTDTLGFQAGGTTALTISATSGGYLTTEVVRANNEFQAGNGSDGDPSFGFINDGDAGMYLYTTGTIGFNSGGGGQYVFMAGSTQTGTAGTKGIGALQVNTWNDVELSSTAGQRVGAQSWGWDAGSNLVGLELEALRDATGSTWTTAAVGFRRITDATSQASLWFYQSRVGVNKSGPQWTFEVGGTLGATPYSSGTSGWDAHWVAGAGSTYQLYRFTSSRRYKREIDYDTDFLADYELKPVTFYGTKHENVEENLPGDYYQQSIGFISEDVAENDERLAVRNNDGLVDVYSKDGVMAVLAAKANRADERYDEQQLRIGALEARIAVLESR